MNSITLIGRAGRDPEFKTFESGKMVASFTLAVNGYKRDDEPDWFTVEIWGRQAQTAADYVRKGSQIAVIGSVKLETWTDRTTGAERSKMKVSGDRLELLGSKRDSGDDSPAPAAAPARRQAPAGQPPAWDGSSGAEDDDIPF